MKCYVCKGSGNLVTLKTRAYRDCWRCDGTGCMFDRGPATIVVRNAVPNNARTTNSNEFNFVHKDVSQDDRELFLGPIEPDEVFTEFDDSWSMANVWVSVGVFTSLTQARKNNDGGPIPPGYTDIVRGKKRIKVFVLNRLDNPPKEA